MSAEFHSRRQFLAHHAWRERRLLAVIAVLMLVAAGAAALQPLPMKLLVDYGLRGDTLPDWLRPWIAPDPTSLIIASAFAAILVFVVNAAVDTALTWTWSVAGQRMVYGLANDLFAKLMRLTPLYHTKSTAGDSISRLTGDTWCVYSFVSGIVMGPVHQILTLASVGTVAFSLDSQLALISLGMAPLLALSSVYFGSELKARAKAGRKADASLLSFVQQTLTSLPVVQAFAAEDRHREQFGALAEHAISTSKQSALVNSSFGMVNGAVTTIGTAAVLYFGGARVLSGTMPLGTLIVFLAYIQSMQAGLEALLKVYGGYKPLEASIDRVLDILGSKELVAESPAPEPLPPIRRQHSGHIVLEKVTFGYDLDRPVLHELSLQASPGERIAIIGRSGAGKSTLLSLAARLFDPWSGRILMDGVDLRCARLSEVRERISMVLQEPFLFPVSVRENIALGRPEATDEEIVQAARAAGAHDFITRLPEGYASILGERGSTLSGGERQRIAIARAFLKDAPVLILDEPTAALDARTEQSVMDALDRLCEGRTAFVIAHRLSTVRRATRIVVIEDGRIVESGSHEELLASKGAYSRYHAAQFAEASEVVA